MFLSTITVCRLQLHVDVTVRTRSFLALIIETKMHEIKETLHIANYTKEKHSTNYFTV